MVYFISNVLSKEECLFLAKQFDIERVNHSSGDKIVDTNASFGFRPSYNFDKYMETLKPKVLEFNNEIEHLDNVNTYVREYRNSAFLTKHVDRTDISVTMSICLESTINKEWPLFVEIDGKEYSHHTNIGDGIILFGADKNTHWRNLLICNEDKRVLQFFLHWMPINYVAKKTKTII
jgi:hypothetical protein